MDALTLLKKDHDQVKKILKDLDATTKKKTFAEAQAWRSTRAI